jgi:hypothetical protein
MIALHSDVIYNIKLVSSALLCYNSSGVRVAQLRAAHLISKVEMRRIEAVEPRSLMWSKS